MAVLSVLSKIALIAQEMQDAGRQADRLVRRLLSIAEPIRAIQESNRHDDSSVAVAEVLAIVKEAHNFLSEYRKANRFTRACKRKAHADEFADLSRRYEEFDACCVMGTLEGSQSSVFPFRFFFHSYHRSPLTTSL